MSANLSNISGIRAWAAVSVIPRALDRRFSWLALALASDGSVSLALSLTRSEHEFNETNILNFFSFYFASNYPAASPSRRKWQNVKQPSTRVASNTKISASANAKHANHSSQPFSNAGDPGSQPNPTPALRSVRSPHRPHRTWAHRPHHLTRFEHPARRLTLVLLLVIRERWVRQPVRAPIRSGVRHHRHHRH